ncbi:putative polysaccharide export (CAP59) [Fusarium heterosporum]|uniref:Putative polysaccharide export (CAP59) n=1 Tax=Fusarium heterosporum TaxID=42747 RepID=A0A8H5TLV7_FUSHE|nr:putative polysaccharide export (CAP59) [Fusarium heterosporum]
MVSHTNRLYLRRLLRSRFPKIIFFLIILINILDVLRIHRNLLDADRTPAPKLSQPPERIYIASMHFNNERVIRDHWGPAVIELSKMFGKDNVFVSVFESGSWDKTKWELQKMTQELERLGIPHRVDMSDATHKDEIENPDKGEGWIDTSRGKRELRRIPFLAKLRNRTLQDLIDLNKKGQHFDKVLFLNDVVFTTEDVLKLLSTNGGEYAAACSLDFSKPPEYYDTFALRDTDGQAHAMHSWPYFKSSVSRNALVNHLDAVPVASCWNGIVAMPTEPFISSSKLRFRGISDSLAEHHLEGCECCLIHADNPLSKTRGVYLNPRVRVGYNLHAYQAVHPEQGAWVSTWQIFSGLWINRIMRWVSSPFDSWVVRRRVAAWEKEGMGRKEPGEFCLINEMQVLVERGWAHV